MSNPLEIWRPTIRAAKAARQFATGETLSFYDALAEIADYAARRDAAHATLVEAAEQIMAFMDGTLASHIAATNKPYDDLRAALEAAREE